MRRPHAGEALGLGFDHRSKVVAAVGALLLPKNGVRFTFPVAFFGLAGRWAQYEERGL
jgi:hypothetical protein